MSLFETGMVVMTCGIRDLLISDEYAQDVVQRCLEMHSHGYWGDLCEEDKQMNDEALDMEA